MKRHLRLTRERLAILLLVYAIALVFIYWLLVKSTIRPFNQLCFGTFARAQHVFTGEKRIFSAGCIPYFWEYKPFRD